MNIFCVIIGILCLLTQSAIIEDRMSRVPGYPESYNTSAYSGYLNVSAQRQLHYVFLQSINGANNSDPVTLWLNGGPGCSSLLGFLQQIGPYYLQDGANYKDGDELTFNPYSWYNISNLLFLQSPAGVGFSYNLDKSFAYNDEVTAQDNLNAVLKFFEGFPELKDQPFWIAGQSYAGKYIPDLAVLLDKYNQQQQEKINFKGMLIGNGVMSFEELQQNSIEFMIDHEFIDPETVEIWRNSCQQDEQSPRCSYFFQKFEQDTSYLNPYNVYGYCFYESSDDNDVPRVFETQQSMLYKRLAQLNKKSSPKFNGAPCAYFDGVYNYFNIHATEYHAKFPGMIWNGPCATNISYHMDPDGSIQAYSRLLLREPEAGFQIVLYNGDWDDVVPLRDTLENLKSKLGLKMSFPRRPWFVNDQHAGFSEVYGTSILFISVKGASHQVPQSKRAESFFMYENIILHKGMGQEKQKNQIQIE